MVEIFLFMNLFHLDKNKNKVENLTKNLHKKNKIRPKKKSRKLGRLKWLGIY